MSLTRHTVQTIRYDPEDPREKLLRILIGAQRRKETHVTVPVDLALQAIEVKECGHKQVCDFDIDGPFKEFELTCALRDSHTEDGLWHRSRGGGYEWNDEGKIHCYQ